MKLKKYKLDSKNLRLAEFSCNILENIGDF